MEDEIKEFIIQNLKKQGIGRGYFYKIFNDLTNLDDLVIKYQKLLSKGLIVKPENNKSINKLAKVYNINLVFPWEDKYPTLLKQIYQPPVILFYKGELVNNDLVSIVGTRKATDYGKRFAKEMAERLSEAGIGVVSGMAMGIDREAHNGALQYSAGTIAVLAGSVNKPSPVVNIDVYQNIIKTGGAIVSEYFPDTKIVPGMFVERNRIIAGISSKTVVVEASRKSGALSTALFAFENNREVYAVPGRPDMDQYSGTNNLIKTGVASLILNIDDFIGNIMGLRLVNSNDFFEGLDANEILVCKTLQKDTLFIEEIQNLTKLNFQLILNTCILLEMKGKLIKNSTGKYSLNTL